MVCLRPRICIVQVQSLCSGERSKKGQRPTDRRSVTTARLHLRRETGRSEGVLRLLLLLLLPLPG